MLATRWYVKQHYHIVITLHHNLFVCLFTPAPDLESVRQGRIQKIVLGRAYWTWVAEDDEARCRRLWGEMYGQGVYPPTLQPTRGFGERRKAPPAGSRAEPQLLIISGHYMLHNILCDFVHVYRILESNRNAIRLTKPNRSDHFCRPWCGGGTCPLCPPPIWIRPCGDAEVVEISGHWTRLLCIKIVNGQ